MILSARQTSEGAASRYIGAFAGRTDVYGVWTPVGWRPRRLPLTPSVVIEAFLAGSPLTFYFLPHDEMTHVAGIDFDTDDGFEQAIRVGRGMWDDDVPAYVEASRRGAHLWITLDERVHALIARAALRAHLQAAGLPLSDPKIELRPGERINRADGIGLSLRAPMLPHPLTGEARILLDPRTEKPLGHSLAEVMQAVQRAAGAQIVAAAERYRPPESPVSPQARMCDRGEGRIADFNSTIGVTQILRDAGARWARPGGHGRCPYHADRNPSMSVGWDDRRAWCWSPACVVHRDGKGMDAWDLARLAAVRSA